MLRYRGKSPTRTAAEWVRNQFAAAEHVAIESSPSIPGRCGRLGSIVSARPVLLIFPENVVPGIGSIVNALVLFGIMTISVVAGLVMARGSLECIFRVMTFAAGQQHIPAAERQPAFVSTLVRDVAA